MHMHTHIPWKQMGYNIEPEKDQLKGEKKEDNQEW